jgi:pimeloyl-ACP methyl ester carboxylesterase
MPGETLLSAHGRRPAAEITGLVIVAHGGTGDSTAPTLAWQGSVLRMIPVARSLRRSLSGTGAVVWRPRFTVRGWNGAEASPVADVTALLDEAKAVLGPVPVLLVGHSMGGRAVLRAAGHPMVTAVAGLAPWLPDGEPVSQLAGRRVLLMHGHGDRITSTAETWAYAGRAAEVATVATIEIAGTEHAMLRRARLWHQLTAAFARQELAPGAPGAPGAPEGPPALSGPVADAFARPARPGVVSAPLRI